MESVGGFYLNTIENIDRMGFYALILFSVSSCISTAGVSIALTLGFILMAIRYYKSPVAIGKEVKILLGLMSSFFMVLFLISFWSYDIRTSLVASFSHVPRFAILLLPLFFIKNNRQLAMVTVALAISILFSDIYGIFQYLTSSGRPVGFNTNAIFFANNILIILLLMIGSLFQRGIFTNAERIFLYLASLLSCIMLILNKTRGVWVAFILTIILSVFFTARKNIKMAMYMVGLVVAFILLSFCIPDFSERLYNVTNPVQSRDIERIYIWISAWNMFLDHPLVGVGPGMFGSIYNNNYLLPSAIKGFVNAHNTYLHFLAEAGFIGTVSFVILFGYILRICYKKTKESQNGVYPIVAFLITVGFLISGLSDYNFAHVPVIRLYWFSLGVCFAGIGLTKSVSMDN